MPLLHRHMDPQTWLSPSSMGVPGGARGNGRRRGRWAHSGANGPLSAGTGRRRALRRLRLVRDEPGSRRHERTHRRVHARTAALRARSRSRSSSVRRGIRLIAVCRGYYIASLLAESIDGPTERHPVVKI
jgi:hypothetical protein